jgi:hypothetical protein
MMDGSELRPGGEAVLVAHLVIMSIGVPCGKRATLSLRDGVLLVRSLRRATIYPSMPQGQGWSAREFVKNALPIRKNLF